MQHKNTIFLLVVAGLILVIGSGLWLATATPASAQCGSQASSCKNCHETQAEMPVNADGTGWHQSHAFGDFCYICHAGNQQATDKAAAHEGMVAPLSDAKASCQQCHVADLDARAKVYADALGVEVGSAAPIPASGGDSVAAPIAAAPASASSACNEMVVDDPNAVDYVANYNEIVLGKKPTNWGDMILLGLIGIMLVGGGGFVVTREKLVSVKFGDTKAVDNEYPADVVDMLPQIASLKAGARKSLKNVLENKKAEKVLNLMDEVVKKDEE
ncbi:MAG: hypothetical protein CO094_03565 [Anaerolineae bacterium CG_4_9_14_3_um_filter_57_17]|nr:hypothetical protein [bacterium]NCT19566.1 hypothetical protein [bacterium]OIO85148.1 MAG: hypothetical protein AUK01_06970 [Anaerolineae bacterium CG2_30_57_67]PJB67621.1 MAG: hypothetical protein CO094_03565 [Anaerolineae bacterium CG_4_9_14_3_um_filter_57_17]